MTEQQPAPSSWEFRLSPDRLDFAVYDPDKGRWFVPNAPMRGQWVDRVDMDRMGWTRYESAAAPSAPADWGALYRELADEAAEWGGVITEQELRRKARQATAAVLPAPDSQTAELERLRKEHATWRKLGQRNLERAHEENARLRAVVARLRQMTDHWEQQLPEVIRTPAVVSAIRAALERAEIVPSAPVDQTALRDRIRRAVCEAEGFAWDTDMLEPDEYGEVADTVLAVLPAPAGRAAILREAADCAYRIARRLDDQHHDERAQGAWDVENVLRAELRRVADETPQPETPDVVAAIVAALQERAGELSELAEEQMRPSLEERAQEWHEAVDVARRAAKAAAAAPAPFTPPAHYRRDDGVDCCVHTIPVGPDSCPHCRELHDDDQPAVGAQQPKEAAESRAVCVCGHTRGEHVIVGGPFGRGRLLCTVCNGLEGNACKEFEAL